MQHARARLRAQGGDQTGMRRIAQRLFRRFDQQLPIAPIANGILNSFQIGDDRLCRSWRRHLRHVTRLFAGNPEAVQLRRIIGSLFLRRLQEAI